MQRGCARNLAAWELGASLCFSLALSWQPDRYFWILAILARKFGIAFTALMFNRNPAFQMAIALLVMFAAYAMQVRCGPRSLWVVSACVRCRFMSSTCLRLRPCYQVKFNPYMSPSEHGDVLRTHALKVEEGNPLHSKLAASIASVRERGKRAARGTGMQRRSTGEALSGWW